MRSGFGAAAIATAALIASVPVFAHHSGAAEFDSNKKIDLTGTVTKVEWTNPHAHFYIDVKDSSGNVVTTGVGANASIKWLEEEFDQGGRHSPGERYRR